MSAQRRWVRWPTDPGRARFGYGADYNPDQWPREVWDQDVRLMREAGVTIVSLAIFSWAWLQPTRQTWDFTWLDEVMDLLHENGVAVDLATATASPPPSVTSRFDVVVSPVLHVMPSALSQRLERFVAAGGYPGALRDLLGIRVEEFAPLLDDERAVLDDGSVGTLWSEQVSVVDPATEVLASYTGGHLAGRPAVTRRGVGAGVRSVLPEHVAASVEMTVRRGGQSEFVFLVNRIDAPVTVALEPREVVVLRRALRRFP